MPFPAFFLPALKQLMAATLTSGRHLFRKVLQLLLVCQLRLTSCCKQTLRVRKRQVLLLPL